MQNDEAERLIARLEDVYLSEAYGTLCLRAAALIRAQAVRIAELEAERENDFMRGVSYGQANMPKGTFTVVDSPELVTLRARAEAAEADVARLREAIRHAHDTLYELNPCNYDHDEVCRVNDASVEVILSLAPLLGEAHGKTPEWWADRAALQPKEEDV